MIVETRSDGSARPAWTQRGPVLASLKFSPRVLAQRARWALLCSAWVLASPATPAQPNPATPSVPNPAIPAQPNPATPSVPEAERGAPVSLSAILAYADRRAPALIVAHEQLRLGQAAEVAASPLLPENPTLSLGAGVRRTAGEGYADWSAALTQTVDLAGKRGLRLTTARRTQQRLQAQLEEARWEVHRDVHAAFHLALVARERLAAVERLSSFQQRLLDIARGRLRAGDVSPLAVRLAQGESSQAQVAQLVAEQEYLQARLQLAAVAGWPAADPPTPAGALDEPRDPPSSERLTAMARRYQPRLRSLNAMQVEAQAQAQSAARDAWPEPTFGVQVGQEGGPPGAQERYIVGTLALPLPLVQRNQGARAMAEAESAVIDARERAFSAQLLHRIERHRTAVANAALRVRAYGQQILPRFEENLRLLQRAFELGEIDILQVSVARERFLRIRMDALDAHGAYFRAVAELEASIGVDLWPDEHARHAVKPRATGAQ